MQTNIIVLLIVVVIVAAAVIAWLVMQQRRREQLRHQFGPEYDRAAERYGTRVDTVLQERAERVRELHIRPLSAEQKGRYDEAWRSVQSRFVDDPEGAVGEADRLIGEVMQTRGYPVGEFEQRAADISVDHPQVVENYRAGHQLAGRAERGEASTEDLRQAMVHYRALFSDLLETTQPQVQEVRQ